MHDFVDFAVATLTPADLINVGQALDFPDVYQGADWLAPRLSGKLRNNCLAAIHLVKNFRMARAAGYCLWALNPEKVVQHE